MATESIKLGREHVSLSNALAYRVTWQMSLPRVFVRPVCDQHDIKPNSVKWKTRRKRQIIGLFSNCRRTL